MSTSGTRWPPAAPTRPDHPGNLCSRGCAGPNRSAPTSSASARPPRLPAVRWDVVLAAIAARTNRIDWIGCYGRAGTTRSVFQRDRRSAPSPADGPRSSSAGLQQITVPPSVTTCPTTRSFSRRRRSCSPNCSRADRSPGTSVASLLNQVDRSHTESGPFPAWIGVGGSLSRSSAPPGTVADVVIIGGSTGRFTPFSKLFQQALERLGEPLLRSECTGPVMWQKPTNKHGRNWPALPGGHPAGQPDAWLLSDGGFLRAPGRTRRGRSTSDRRRPWHRRS